MSFAACKTQFARCACLNYGQNCGFGILAVEIKGGMLLGLYPFDIRIYVRW